MSHPVVETPSKGNQAANKTYVDRAVKMWEMEILFTAGVYDGVVPIPDASRIVNLRCLIRTPYDNAGTTIDVGQTSGGSFSPTFSAGITVTAAALYPEEVATEIGGGDDTIRVTIGGGVSTAGSATVQVFYCENPLTLEAV